MRKGEREREREVSSFFFTGASLRIFGSSSPSVRVHERQGVRESFLFFCPFILFVPFSFSLQKCTIRY